MGVSVIERARALVRKLLLKVWSPAVFAYMISAAVAGASFLSTMLLARAAGPAVIGQYALAMSTATLLASFAVLGLDRVLIREVAGDLRQGHTGRARTALRHITMMVAAAAAATTLVYLAVVTMSPLVERIAGDYVAMLIVGVSALVWPLQRLGYSALRAVHAPIQGQLFEALPTLLFTAGIGLIFLIGLAPTAQQAVALMAGAQALACLGAWVLLRPHVRKWDAADKGVTDHGILMAGIPMMITLFLQLFADWLLLARLSSTMGAHETGAFRVAIQITTIFATVLATTEGYVAARLAGDFRAGRPDLAWARHRRATILMLGMTAPALLLLFVAPNWLLRTAFGPEFEMAATALMIMAVGQLVTMIRGPLGALLTMGGHERAQLLLTLVGLAMTVALALLLIPRYGLAGAAIAQAASLIFRSVSGYVFALWKIPKRAIADE